MPSGTINVGAAIEPGVLATFGNTYDRESAALAVDMTPMMDLARPSNGRYEIYAAFKSSPHARRWDKGNKRSFKGFGSFRWVTENLTWECGSHIDEDDLSDDRSNLAEKRAMDSAKSAAEIPYRVYSQIIAAATNPLLLETIPNAPDGQAIFSATGFDSGDRFGRSGGNIVTGTGVASPQDILFDFFASITAMGSFLDTEGLPLHSIEALRKGGFDVMYPLAHYKLFTDAFKASQQIKVITNIAATENVAATVIDNSMRSGDVSVTLHPNALLSGNDWIVSARAVSPKPVYQQVREAMRYQRFDRNNSRENWVNRLIEWSWDWREGYGVNIPYGIVQVNNN